MIKQLKTNFLSMQR